MKRFIYVSILLSFISCLDNVEIKTDEFNPNIVVNTIICPGDTSVGYLSYSRPSTANPQIVDIKEAYFNIFDSIGNSFPFRYSDKNYCFKSNLMPLNGQTYQLKVLVEGFDTVSSETTIPYPVKINNIQLKTIYGESNLEDFLQVSTSFKDSFGSKNYYFFKVEMRGIHANSEYYQDVSFIYNWKIDDPILGIADKFYSPRILVFDDDLIDGLDYTIHFDIYASSLSLVESYDSLVVIPKLYSVSPEFYFYCESLNKQKEASNSPFVEPVKVYNNIKNGFGIFAGISVSTDTATIAIKDVIRKEVSY